MLKDFQITADNGNTHTVRIAIGNTKYREMIDVDLVERNPIWLCRKEDFDSYTEGNAEIIKNHCQSNANWVDAILCGARRPQPFTPNSIINYQGKPCMLTINNDKTKATWSRFETRQGYKRIFAPAKGFTKHVATFLEAQALAIFRQHCDEFGKTLTNIWEDELHPVASMNKYERNYHREYGEVTYRTVETYSRPIKRWGDCNMSKLYTKKDRRIRFDWRVVTGDPEHIEYLAAHEMSHLLEMNHSRKFYSLVSQCLHCDGKQADKAFDKAQVGWKQFGKNERFYRIVNTATDVDYVNSQTIAF